MVQVGFQGISSLQDLHLSDICTTSLSWLCITLTLKINLFLKC